MTYIVPLIRTSALYNIDWATIERALVYSTTDTNLPANTQVKIPLNSLQGMSSGFSLNDGELVVEHDGVYLVQAFVMLVNAPGYTGIRILVNGSERLTRFYTSSGVGMLGTQSILLSLQANQKLRLTVNSANASRTGAYNNRTGITINRVG